MAADLYAALEACTEIARSDAGYRKALEELLVRVAPDESDALMMLMKESRGAWGLMLAHGGGSVLFCGNALSGTPVALAAIGFQVVVMDRSMARLAWSAERSADLTPGRAEFVLAGHGPELPFEDGAFDLCVQEDGLPGPSTGWGHGPEELRRVARGEVLVTADNRLGYKRSTGRRGRFQRSPFVLVRESLWPRRGERTLPSTRAAICGDSQGTWRAAGAYALYPHAREFSHLVGLDANRPRLTIGTQERRNKLKIIGRRLGLFRWLTPSFAVHAVTDRAPESRRVDRLLASVAETLGVGTPTVDIAIATRSNNVLILTEGEAIERWAVHAPLQPCKRGMVRRHFDWLQEVRRRLPLVPVPKPLFAGDVCGVEVAVAERLGGVSGTEMTGNAPGVERMIVSSVAVLEHLLEPRPTPMTDRLFDELVQARVDRVIARVPGEGGTKGALMERTERFRSAVVGRAFRLALYHADLRPKHLRVSPAGDLIGILDWGASERRFLPLADLLQLVVHQRKQDLGQGASLGDGWRAVVDEWTGGAPTTVVAGAVRRYLDAAGLDEEDMGAWLDAYPLFVSGMAERNWDFSRPDWVRRQFQI